VFENWSCHLSYIGLLGTFYQPGLRILLYLSSCISLHSHHFFFACLIISVFLYISTFTSLFFCLSYYICLLVYLYIHITFFCLFLILRNWKELICSYCYKCKASVVQTPWTPGWPINTEYSLPQNAKVSCWKYVSFVCICLVHFSTVCLTLTWQLEFVGCFITQFSVNRLFYLHNL
jgi:hypothetical protein